MRSNVNIKNFGEYIAKSIKEWNSPDGGGFTCNLYRGKIKIAEVYDDGRGGGAEFRWLKPEEEKQLRAFVKKLPVVKFEGMDLMDLNVDMGWFASELVSAIKEKRACRKKTLFILKDDPHVWEIREQYCPVIVEWLRKKHGDKLDEIINERYATT